MDASVNDCFEDSELDQFAASFKKGNQTLESRRSALTLQDLSAKVVARHFEVRLIYSEVPEAVARKIMFWSFPRTERAITRYSLHDRIPYNRYWVKEIIQIGFCVVGMVADYNEEFNVSLTFDKCVVTAVKCSCRENSVLWCIHATILAIHRIRYSNDVKVCLPRFQELNRLNRDQLQKLLQYLLAYHNEDVGGEIVVNVRQQLPPCRALAANSQETKDSSIFTVVKDSRPTWFLDTERLIKYRSKIRKRIVPLMERIIYMINANDRNGLKIFRCLLEAEIDIPSDVRINEKLIKSLTFVLAGPHISPEEKQEFRNLMCSWRSKYIDSDHYHHFSSSDSAKSILAPYENVESLPFGAGNGRLYVMPLCAAYLTWDDPRLKLILSDDLTSYQKSTELNLDEKLVWREHLPTSCVRVRALQLGGFHAEAFRLSVAICRAMKLQVKRWTETWKTIHPSLDPTDITEESAKDIVGSSDGEWMNYSLITHRVNPLEILLNPLMNSHRMIKDSVSTPSGARQYYQLAVEALIIIFSQQVMSYSSSWEERAQRNGLMEIVVQALQGKHASIDSAWVVDNEAIKNLIESLLQAGIFTSCGNFNYFAVVRCDWILSMTRAILNLDKDLAVKFALACLPKENQLRWTSCVCSGWTLFKEGYSDCRLFHFLLTDFPQNIAIKVLEIFKPAKSTDELTSLWQI